MWSKQKCGSTGKVGDPRRSAKPPRSRLGPMLDPTASLHAGRVRQPLGKFGPAPSRRLGADRQGQGFDLAHQHHQPLAPCDGGVQQGALQHDVVLGGDRNHHGGVLGPLRLVDGGGVRQPQRIQVRDVVPDIAVLEPNRECLIVGAYRGSRAVPRKVR